MNDRQELFNAIHRLTGHHCIESEMDEIEHLVRAPIDEERYQELEDALRRGLHLEIARLNERAEIAEWHGFDPAARDLRAFPPDRYRIAAFPTPAAAEIMAEQRRQINAEGLTPEHDDQYWGCELIRAAGDYVMHTALVMTGKDKDQLPAPWPWPPPWCPPPASESSEGRSFSYSYTVQVAQLHRRNDKCAPIVILLNHKPVLEVCVMWNPENDRIIAKIPFPTNTTCSLLCALPRI